MKTICVSGTGYSGSGAVLDLLSEYENCLDVCGSNDEFMFTYIPDGIDDLYYHLCESKARFQSSDVAISRFLELILKLGKYGWDIKTNGSLQENTHKFCESISQVTWQGNWLYDLLQTYDNKSSYFKYRICRKMNTLKGKFGIPKDDIIPLREMRVSVSPDHILEIIQDYLDTVICSCMKYDSSKVEYVILNQAVPANNPVHFMKYFHNMKVIVVYRDPRDTFLNINNVNKINARWYPTDVNKFISYYKIMNDGILTVDDNNILVVRFEDLIYDYNDTVNRIEYFLGIDNCHLHPLKSFDPGKSIQNTQLFRYYRANSPEIRKIEQSLSDYIYNFDESIEIDHNSQF